MLTGAVLWSTRSLSGAPEGAEPDLRGAGAIGVGQALAILPGISRSGTTIAVALWLRVTPERAAEFSFLLAIPAIAAFNILKNRVQRLTLEVGILSEGLMGRFQNVGQKKS